MASNDEFDISRSSTFRSRRASAARSGAFVGLGMSSCGEGRKASPFVLIFCSIWGCAPPCIGSSVGGKNVGVLTGSPTCVPVMERFLL